MSKQSKSMKQWKAMPHCCCVCGTSIGIHPHHKVARQDPYWEETGEDMDAPGNLAGACNQCHADYIRIVGEVWGRTVEKDPIKWGARASRWLKHVRQHHPRDAWAMCQNAVKIAYMDWFTASDEEREEAGK